MRKPISSTPLPLPFPPRGQLPQLNQSRPSRSDGFIKCKDTEFETNSTRLATQFSTPLSSPRSDGTLPATTDKKAAKQQTYSSGTSYLFLSASFKSAERKGIPAPFLCEAWTSWILRLL